MHFSTTSALLLLGLPLAAFSKPTPNTNAMATVISQVAPDSASEQCTDTPQSQGQCRTACQSAGPFQASLTKYNITSKPEIAALISLMALESGEFKYQRNIFPGRPGQGTRNMQMAPFNLEYASSIPAIAPELDPIKNDPDAVLSLLLTEDEYDFGSAAWFLTTQCTPEVRTALQSGSQTGWEQYLTQCIGTTVSPERKVYWDKAMTAVQSL